MFAYQISQALILVGLILTIVEWVSTYFMLPVLGTVGIPILFKTIRTAPGAQLSTGRGAAVVGGRALRVQRDVDQAVLSTVRGRSVFAARSAWPLKCTIQLEPKGGSLRLVARMPFGLPVFMAGWFLPFLRDQDLRMVVGGIFLLTLFVLFEIYRALDSAMSVAKALHGPPAAAA